VPETEALLSRFGAANTQVLGISIDSVFCHANWAVSVGGVSFPLLADFHPKGAVAQSYGLYLEDAGITDRATVIIDAGGTVRHISSATPGGRRDIGELAALCEKVDMEYDGQKAAVPAGGAFPAGSTLFVKSACGFSLKAMNACRNLHLENAVTIKNITEDASAKADLMKVGGKDQAPCLVVDGKPMYEADDIVKAMIDAVAYIK
jgi:glutaredoxin